jgi:HK97 family phage portal protein
MKTFNSIVSDVMNLTVEKSQGSFFSDKNAIASVVTANGVNGHSESLLHSYNNMPHLRATIEKISSSVAQVNWYLKEKDRDYSNYQNKSYSEMPIPSGGQEFLDFWNKGNSFMSGFLCKKLAQAYMELIGEYYIFLNYKVGGKKPFEYYVIKPSWISFNKRTGYTVRFGELSNSKVVENVQAEDLVRIYNPDPLSPIADATSIATALADEISTDEEAAKYLKAFFVNGASPEAIISIPGATPTQLQHLRSSWNNENQGTRKRHGVHFVPGTINYHKIQQGLDELRMVELRQYQRNTIIQSYGVPPEMLGIIENSNRSTIAGAEWIYMKTVVIPRLELIKGEIQSKIVNRFFDDRLILEYENPLPQDPEITKDLMKNHPYAFTVNEIRQAAGLPPISEEEGGMKMVETGDNNGFNNSPKRVSELESAGELEKD